MNQHAMYLDVIYASEKEFTFNKHERLTFFKDIFIAVCIFISLVYSAVWYHLLPYENLVTAYWQMKYISDYCSIKDQNYFFFGVIINK